MINISHNFLIHFIFRKIKSCVKTWKKLIARFRYWESQLPVISQPLEESSEGYKVTHISAFTYANMGDCVLPICLRKLFADNIGIKKWHSGDVTKVVDNLDVKLMNRDDFIVLGGGGLLVKPRYPENSIENTLSGWLWFCDEKHLREIKKPIIMFAVGYNRFRGEEEFDQIFTKNINEFVSKSDFVGLRNHGSIEKVRGYLQTQELKDKLCFQPCMTTLISKLYPNFVDYNNKENFIAINCAYDRETLRADNLKRYAAIAKVAKNLSEKAKIKVYLHKDSDRQISKDLEQFNVEYEIVGFNTAEEVVRDYSRARLVIGMRGHAQMIPFGCHTPILSIISHDKMQYFLDDIHHPEWGVEFNDDSFEDKLYEKAIYIYDNYKDVMREIEKEQEILWNITMQNMQTIKRIISKS